MQPNKPIRGLPWRLAVKDPPAIQETWVPPLGWGDALEKGLATHSSILAWEISCPGILQARILECVAISFSNA